MEEYMKKRVKYRVVEADIIGVSVEADKKLVCLTLYSDKVKTQTNIFLDEEGIKQVSNILGSAIDYVGQKNREILPGYQ